MMWWFLPLVLASYSSDDIQLKESMSSRSSGIGSPHEHKSPDEIEMVNLGTSIASPETDVYFEKQDGYRCGVHAVNNLLGYRAYTSRQMDMIAERLRREVNHYVATQQSDLDFVSSKGEYEINTLIRSLQNLGLKVEHLNNHKPSVPLVRDFVGHPNVIGFLLNYKLADDSRHWSAIRRNDDRWFYMDSGRAGPRVRDF